MQLIQSTSYNADPFFSHSLIDTVNLKKIANI